ncbi:MAG: RNA polymerase sigma factor [Actinobacteria bacterium]|nr:RNA polymerase sigma factor [Actinomycetota bacterium]
MHNGVTAGGCAVLPGSAVPLRAAAVADTTILPLAWLPGPSRNVSAIGTVSQRSPANRRNALARLRTSDQQAVEDLFNASYPRLAGWVRRLVDDDETAHEIASEAFTRLLSRWTGLDNPQSYLYMIATNLVRDHWRKMGRERQAIRVLSTAGSADPTYHPSQDVDVRALIQGLPERLRSPFLLHYYAGFGLKEVAAMLGRPEGTIKADLFNARARLKAALGEASD